MGNKDRGATRAELERRLLARFIGTGPRAKDGLVPAPPAGTPTTHVLTADPDVPWAAGGGGGGGAVDSVNGQTGTVVLDAGDVGADPTGSAAAAQAASQPLDGELTAIAGLTSAANKIVRFTGSGTADLLTVTATPTASAVPIADSSGLLDGWVTNVPDSTYYRGGNLHMNWPVITGQTSLPEWWDDAAQITTTVSTCTAEGITKAIDERVFKHVTSGSGSGAVAYQRLTLADHQGFAVTNAFSASRWVYQAGSDTISLIVKDSTAATLGTATTTASGTWTLLKVQNVTPTGGSTYVDVQVSVNANSVTFFSTAPMCNVGTAAKPFEPNPLLWCYAADDTLSTDPANTNFTTQSFATPAHPLACLLLLSIEMVSTGGGRFLRVEPSYTTGSTSSAYNHAIGTPAANVTGIGTRLVNCSDAQAIQWRVNNADVSSLKISLAGYFRFAN